MKRVILAVLGTITGLVMLLGFKTQQAPTPAAIGTSSVGTGTAGAAVPASPSGQTSASGKTAAGSTSTAVRSVTGAAANTPYGPVQVQVSLKGSKITDIKVLQYPSGHREDAQINGYALPILNQAALAVQSARIDSVSGATYTSQGYVTSLQSALDKAGITR